MPILEDRVVQQALTDILMHKYEKFVFHNWSMGYRPGRGVESALQVIIKNIEFFACIGLVPSKWCFYYKMLSTYNIEKYVEYHMQRNKVYMGNHIQKLKEQDIGFYTKDRLKNGLCFLKIVQS